ncbi:ABC-F family ATP-binding cassette domain-containing protein [Microbacterium protaetiae]|uniref:ABC-F family ATP-binding cassette domain-containing protein n=1 Tax=Microbacterium protaetiae TaxID=2509458 RepID=A0A4P6E918_9MICO|nr:ABC-F family ATP-binding cassette domain-containing protein [Microbacterium protaetiae]QAY58570.1 ABC-F family ATP-binding cassette domain-containing protein [Microbacterium protaetiae]
MLTPPVLPARSRAQLVASNVGVTRGTTPVLTGVDLVVTPSSRIAVVGENGRGKSTLLHVLAGTLTPDEGSVTRIGTLEIAEQEMTTADERTVGEAVADAIADALAALAHLDAAACALAKGDAAAAERYAAALERAETLDAWDAERRVRVALEALDAEPDWSRRLAELSVGQRYRVRLACLLGGDADFLLLDEPTNHLDRAGLDFLTSRVAERSGGVVIVSHDRALLRAIATTTIDLDATPDGRPRVYGGGYEGYLQGRRAERERWEQEYAQQQAERARLHDDLSAAQNRLVSGWRPPKGTGKHQRATRAGALVQSVHRRQAALDAHELTMPEPPRPLGFPDLTSRAGANLLTAESVTFENRLARPVSVAVTGRSRLLVTGPNGTGKSTLLAVLAGDLTPATGVVHRASGTRIAFLRQESSLPLDSRASDVFAARLDRLAASGTLTSGQTISLSSLGLLGPREAGKRIGELSMGQRRRLDLALVLAARPQVLLLDEPTNHLSVALVDELTDALQVTQAAVVLSTHDRQLSDDLHGWPQLALGSYAPPPMSRAVAYGT